MTPSRPRATSFARVRNTRAPLSDVARNLKAQLAFAQPFSSRPPRPAGLLALAPAIYGGDVDGDGEPAKGERRPNIPRPGCAVTWRGASGRRAPREIFFSAGLEPGGGRGQRRIERAARYFYLRRSPGDGSALRWCCWGIFWIFGATDGRFWIIGLPLGFVRPYPLFLALFSLEKRKKKNVPWEDLLWKISMTW